jgi:hypothetical protein
MIARAPDDRLDPVIVNLVTIAALAAELCGFVDSIAASGADGFCQVHVASVHRARVIVNNLRPLLTSAEQAAAPGSPP